jgi:hypothetical protein
MAERSLELAALGQEVGEVVKCRNGIGSGGEDFAIASRRLIEPTLLPQRIPEPQAGFRKPRLARFNVWGRCLIRTHYSRPCRVRAAPIIAIPI